MKGKAYLAVVAAMIVAVMALAGCSSGSSGSASSAASGSAGASASVASASSASASSAASSAASGSASASSASSSSAAAQSGPLAPGEYQATFKTDSSMFHVNEANNGKGTLTVADDGSMTIHVSLASTRIVNLYAGTKEQAEADQAHIINPTTDKVTYSDGKTEEVYGFDVPVPALGEEFPVAILGEKGAWYDHMVTVSDPV